MQSIYKSVAKQRDSYRSDKITITEGYDFSQYETLRTAELYDNDRFLTGNEDSLGREKSWSKDDWCTWIIQPPAQGVAAYQCHFNGIHGGLCKEHRKQQQKRGAKRLRRLRLAQAVKK